LGVALCTLNIIKQQKHMKSFIELLIGDTVTNDLKVLVVETLNNS